MALEGAQLIEFIMKLKLDPSSAEYAKTTVKAVKDGLVDLAATAEAGSGAATTLTKKLGELNRAAQIEKLGSDFGRMAQNIGNAETAAKLLAGRLAEIGSSEAEIVKAGEAFANAQKGFDGGSGGEGVGGLKRSGEVLSRVGLGEAGRSVSTIGDLAQIGKFKEDLSQLPPTALAAGAGVTAFTVALDLYTKQQQAALKAAQDEISGRQRAIELITTGTREEQQARLNQLEIQRQNNAAVAADATAFFQNFKKQTEDSLGAGAAALEYYAATIGKASGEYQAAYDATNKANAAVNSTTTEMNILTQATGLTAQSIDDVTKAMQNAAYIASDISNRASADIEAYNLANNGSQKQLDDRLRSLQIEFEVTKNAVAMANARADALGRETKEGQAAAAEADKLTQRQNAAGTSIEILSQAFVRNAVAARDAADAEKKRNDQMVQTATKLNDDLAAIDQKAADGRKAIAEKLGETLVAITEKAVDQHQKILDDLEQKQGELKTKLLRDDATAQQKAQFDAQQQQIDYQRQTVTDLKKHLTDLRHIQQDADAQIYEDSLDRNFSGISRDRRELSRTFSRSSETFNDEQQQRTESLTQRNDDYVRQFAFEHQQRLQAFALANQDAIENAKRLEQQNQLDAQQARAKARLAATQDLTDLQNKIVQERSIKNKAAQDDLKLINQTEQEKLNIYKAALEAARKLGSNAQGVLLGGGRLMATRAFGGSLQAGQISSYNELPGQRESFETGGQSYKLPGGAGLIWPAKTGNVNPNGGGGQMITVAPTFNISGADPKAVMRVIDDRLDSTIRKIFRVKAS